MLLRGTTDLEVRLSFSFLAFASHVPLLSELSRTSFLFSSLLFRLSDFEDEETSVFVCSALDDPLLPPDEGSLAFLSEYSTELRGKLELEDSFFKSDEEEAV